MRSAQLRGTFKVGLGQFAAVRYPMFFATEPKIEWDEYGEVCALDSLSISVRRGG